MKISILVSDMSKNTLGRPYLLAKVLSRRYQVEIIGPMFGSRIWPPCDTDDVEYKAITATGFPSFFHTMRRISTLISGDVIYAAAPRLPDFGLALLKKISAKIPVVLDMDEWQVGLLLNRGWYHYFTSGVRNIRDPNSELYRLVMEQLIPLSDQLTVASDFLLEKFGGVKVPHARDTDYLDPLCFEPNEERKKLGLDYYNYIVFLGTPAPHKGVEDIIAALRVLKRNDIKLLIVGADPNVDYVRRYTEHLRAIGDKWVDIREPCPYSDVPRYLSVASLVVLPQRPTKQFVGQVPGKLFDAMAMAKPIVSTTVTEIPKILEGCGWLIPPGDVKSLAVAIEYILSHPDEALEMGLKARERCIQHYSWNAIETTLTKIFDQFK